MRTLRTPRLRLTPVHLSNARTLWRVLQQPDLRRFQDLPTLDATAFAQMVGKRPVRLGPRAVGRFEWLLYEHGVRTPLGWVSLRIGGAASRQAEIGYSLMRQFRRRGLATEAVRALIAEAFATANVDRIQAYCLAENTASRALLDRIGFRYDGVLTHGACVAGRTVDVLGHVLSRSAFAQSHSTETRASA